MTVQHARPGERSPRRRAVSFLTFVALAVGAFVPIAIGSVLMNRASLGRLAVELSTATTMVLP